MSTVRDSGCREPRPLSRRQLLRVTAADALGVAFAHRLFLARAGHAHGAETKKREMLNRFPRMVQEYFVNRVRQAEKLGESARAALNTKADAEKYVQTVRAKIRESFGPFPERTPLNARVTGVVERDAYNIEKVIFESRPGFMVTGNLYVPKGHHRPLPGVVGTCGHSTNGKCEKAYQSFAQGLARMGYVVLIYDPISQGERLQYVGENLKSLIRPGVGEHLQEGNQQFLVGQFLGTWRAWDGVRALDYLLTRDEVDPKQLGVTGNSGGGTMTTWLCGVEHRWTMAAPSCFVTTLRRNMENELPADTEQCPPKALALGLDQSDWLAALAPQPVIILAKERDYFDARGSQEAYARLKHLYRLLGAEDNVGLFIGPTYHGYSQENREAMYRWFNRATGVSDAKTEPKLTIEKDETLWCTPKGQVAPLGSRSVFSFTKETAGKLAATRKKLQGDALKQTVARVLRLPPREGAPYARVLRAIGGRGYPKPKQRSTTYMVATEPGMHAVVYLLLGERHYSRPLRLGKRAVLYVSHLSSDQELRSEPLCTELLKGEPDSAFFTCDVRGVGESRPNTCGTNTYFSSYGSDFFYASHAIMLDYPYVGQRTRDVLRVLDWLRSYGYTDVHLAAKGWGALPATFAALLSGQVTRVTLKNALRSYQEVAQTELYKWPLSSLLPDVLEHFDLPDCYAELEAKQLRQVEPWGAAPESW